MKPLSQASQERSKPRAERLWPSHRRGDPASVCGLVAKSLARFGRVDVAFNKGAVHVSSQGLVLGGGVTGIGGKGGAYVAAKHGVIGLTRRLVEGEFDPVTENEDCVGSRSGRSTFFPNRSF